MATKVFCPAQYVPASSETVAPAGTSTKVPISRASVAGVRSLRALGSVHVLQNRNRWQVAPRVRRLSVSCVSTVPSGATSADGTTSSRQDDPKGSKALYRPWLLTRSACLFYLNTWKLSNRCVLADVSLNVENLCFAVCCVADVALILIRHGESLWNQKNLFTGCVDVPLSQQGVEEAIEAGKRICHIPVDVIFTSALIRAQMTAMLAMTQHRRKKVRLLSGTGEENE